MFVILIILYTPHTMYCLTISRIYLLLSGYTPAFKSYNLAMLAWQFSPKNIYKPLWQKLVAMV